MKRKMYLLVSAVKHLALALSLLFVISPLGLVAKPDLPAHPPKGGSPTRKSASLSKPKSIVNDPIRFTLQANKRQVHVGEEIELTITAELLNISSKLMFFLDGSNAFSLKLLMPEGFLRTDGDDASLMEDALTLSGKPVATYRIRGKFTSATSGTCFRLLRSERNPTSQSRYEQKATLCYQAAGLPTVASTNVATPYILLTDTPTVSERIAANNSGSGQSNVTCSSPTISVANPASGASLTTSSFPFTFTIQPLICVPDGQSVGLVQYNIFEPNGTYHYITYVDAPGSDPSYPYTLTASAWSNNGQFIINSPGTYTLNVKLFLQGGGAIEINSPVTVNVNTTAPPTSNVLSGCFTISNQFSGKSLQIMSDGTIQHQTLVANQVNQIWRLDVVGNSQYKITSQAGNKDQTVYVNSLANGQLLRTGSFSDDINHKWTLETSTGGAYRVQSNQKTWDQNNFGQNPELQIYGDDNSSDQYYNQPYRLFSFSQTSCPTTNPPTPPSGALTFITDSYDCETGIWVWHFTSGDTQTPVQTHNPGAWGYITVAVGSPQSVTLDMGLRRDTPFTIYASQSGQDQPFSYTSCSTSTPPPTGNYLSVNPNGPLTLSSGAGTRPISVSSNVAWSAASSDVSWLTLTNINTNSVTANYTENMGGSSRSATLTFSGSNVSNQTLTFTQNPATVANSVTQRLKFSQQNFADPNEKDPQNPNNYRNDNLGTVPIQHGPDLYPASIVDWHDAGGNSIGIYTKPEHYQINRNQFGRPNQLINQMNKCVELGLSWTYTGAIGRDCFLDANDNDYGNNAFGNIWTTSDVMLRPDGKIATNNLSAVPRLPLLRDFIEKENQGIVDTNNPWYWVKVGIMHELDLIKDYVKPGQCEAVGFTLGGRWEDTYPYGTYQNGGLWISDYHPSTIQDFKTRNPNANFDPQSAYDGGSSARNAFLGTGGKLWYRYCEDNYIMFKSWVASIIRAKIPGSPVLADFGQYVDGDAVAARCVNWPQIAKDATHIKVNPDLGEEPEYAADLVRSTGKVALMEADNTWYSSSNLSDNQFVERLYKYFQAGFTSVQFGQAGGPVYNRVLYLCRTYLATHSLGNVVTINPVTTVTYYSKAQVEGNSYVKGQWSSAGGNTGTRIKMELIDDLPVQQNPPPFR